MRCGLAYDLGVDINDLFRAVTAADLEGESARWTGLHREDRAQEARHIVRAISQ